MMTSRTSSSSTITTNYSNTTTTTTTTTTINSKYSQVIHKIVAVQYSDRLEGEGNHEIGIGSNIIASYITWLLYKFTEFDANSNVTLVFAHSYDIQPFYEKYLQDYNVTIIGGTYNSDERRDPILQNGHGNLKLTHKNAMFNQCLETDMLIFVDYLPSLDDYTHAIRNFANGFGFCYMVFDPETVEIENSSSVYSSSVDLQSHLEKYATIEDICTGSNQINLHPNMQILLTMLEMDEHNSTHSNYNGHYNDMCY